MMESKFANYIKRFLLLGVVAGELAGNIASPAYGQPNSLGQWGPVMKWPNVAIHTHVLPTGKVLFWSRREWGPGGPLDNPTPGQPSLDPHDCTPRIWDPDKNIFTETKKPGHNLFCSGHTFLADGRLMVVGGHLADSQGVKEATIYNPFKDIWEPTDPMNNGRWYPTAVTLPDGSVLVSSGSIQPNQQNNVVQQIWTHGKWRDIVTFNDIPLYPRMHVAPDGQVFLSGANQLTQLLDTHANGGSGVWSVVGNRDVRVEDYAPSVIFDDRSTPATVAGRVLFIGGGNAPTNAAWTIDLNAATKAWQPAKSMKFPRRQHNATILPDGTILVTGGTQGNGGVGGGFDDLTIGAPIRAAELWNPKTGEWTVLAEECVDRCYHSTAVLLPDARVLSAGGGEYRPDTSNPAANPIKDSHLDAQLFSPPYLFRGGTRPTITSAPDAVIYRQDFSVSTDRTGDIADVTWIRLSSVTHSFNQNQRINFLKFATVDGKLQVTPPANPTVCPPGHYMLFLLDKQGVPSVAKIIRITS